MRDKYEFKIGGCLTVIFWSSGKFFMLVQHISSIKNCQTKKSVRKDATLPILETN